jgi:hypothetical protein
VSNKTLEMYFNLGDANTDEFDLFPLRPPSRVIVDEFVRSGKECVRRDFETREEAGQFYNRLYGQIRRHYWEDGVRIKWQRESVYIYWAQCQSQLAIDIERRRLEALKACEDRINHHVESRKKKRD